MNVSNAKVFSKANERNAVQDQMSHEVALPRTLGFAETAEDVREHRDLILMRLRSGRTVAVFADEAEMIVARRAATPLSCAPAAICGVVSVRGRIYTLIDLDLMLEASMPEKSKRDARTGESERNGRAAQNNTRATREVDSMTIALRGDEQLALSVARVERIVAVSVDSLVKLARHAPFLRGVTEHDERLIMVLDPSKIFAHAAPPDENPKTPHNRVR